MTAWSWHWLDPKLAAVFELTKGTDDDITAQSLEDVSDMCVDIPYVRCQVADSPWCRVFESHSVRPCGLLSISF